MTPNRDIVVEILRRRVLGKNLAALASELGICSMIRGRLNKGWVGQTLERAADLSNSTSSQPDGPDFELKSTKVSLREGLWIPRETIKVTNLNPQKILQEEFETSTLWAKLKRLILVGCVYESPLEGRAVFVAPVEVNDPFLVSGVRAIWEDVRHLIVEGEISEHINLGKVDDLLQLRPTGSGKQVSLCPVTGRHFPARAFYATKRLLGQLIPADA